MIKKSFAFLMLLSFQFSCQSMISGFMNRTKKHDNYFPGDPSTDGVNRWAFEGDLEFIKDAIEDGYDINLANKAGETPLMYAAMAGNDVVISFLLDNGAKTDLRESRGYSVLMIAAEMGYKEIVEMLLDFDSEDYVKALEAARKQLRRVKNEKNKEDLLETIETLRGWSKIYLATEVQKQFPEDNVSEIIMSYIK